MAYNGSIDLISGIRPKNNGQFPLVNAKDIYVDETQRQDAQVAQLLERIDALENEKESVVTAIFDPENELISLTCSGSATTTLANEIIEIAGTTDGLPSYSTDTEYITMRGGGKDE